MDSPLRKFQDAFVDQFVKLSATALAAAALAGFVATAAALATLRLDIGIPIAVIAFLIGVYALLRLARRVYVIYPRHPAHIELLCKRITYLVDDQNDTVVTYRKFYSLQALIDGVASFTDVYQWTGTDRAQPHLVSQAGYSLVHLGRESVWYKYQVNFPKELAKGETCEFELEWVLDNADGGAEPFVSTPINEATRLLMFKVVLPDSWFPQDVWCETRRSIDSTHKFRSEALTRTGGAIEWELHNPPLYHHYMIKWLHNGSA